MIVKLFCLHYKDVFLKLRAREESASDHLLIKTYSLPHSMFNDNVVFNITGQGDGPGLIISLHTMRGGGISSAPPQPPDVFHTTTNIAELDSWVYTHLWIGDVGLREQLSDSLRRGV